MFAEDTLFTCVLLCVYLSAQPGWTAAGAVDSRQSWWLGGESRCGLGCPSSDHRRFALWAWGRATQSSDVTG